VNADSVVSGKTIKVKRITSLALNNSNKRVVTEE